MGTRDKIRIVFFSDTHLGFDYPIRPRVERRRRGEDFFDSFCRPLAFAGECRADLVIHGGDIFFRSKVPQKIVDLAYDKLFDFAASGIEFFLVPGNHERSKIPDSLLLSRPNIHIFKQPGTFECRLAGARIAISGFPFIRENIRDRFPEILEATGWRASRADVKLLCLHQAVEGAKVGPANYTFRRGKDVIQMRDLPARFVAVLAGHIHRQQILQRAPEPGAPAMPVIFSGATERTSFAEKDEQKGFYYIELVPAAAGGWKIGRLDFKILPSRPMIDLYLDGGVKEDNLEGFMRARLARIDSNAIVRLQPRGEVEPAVAQRLTTSFLRSIFPRTMNYHMSSAFYRPREEV
jgi:DNA repair exonuclease SbcCD nuclease subunit